MKEVKNNERKRRREENEVENKTKIIKWDNRKSKWDLINQKQIRYIFKDVINTENVITNHNYIIPLFKRKRKMYPILLVF